MPKNKLISNFAVLSILASLTLSACGYSNIPSSNPANTSNTANTSNGQLSSDQKFKILDVIDLQVGVENSLSSQTLTYQSGNIQLRRASNTFFDGPTEADGKRYRYISTTYDVRNASSAGVANSTALTNLSFVAVGRTPGVNGALGNSAICCLQDINNAPIVPAGSGATLAPLATPTHKMTGNASTLALDTDTKNLNMQAYSQTEVATLASDINTAKGLAGGFLLTTAFPYGFIVINKNNGSRTLPANPAVGVYDGTVTVAMKIPLASITTIVSAGGTAPTCLSISLAVVLDDQNRITESLEERALSTSTATARATALGGSTVVNTLVNPTRADYTPTPTPDRRWLSVIPTAGTTSTTSTNYYINNKYDVKGIGFTTYRGAGQCVPENNSPFTINLESASQKILNPETKITIQGFLTGKRTLTAANFTQNDKGQITYNLGGTNFKPGEEIEVTVNDSTILAAPYVTRLRVTSGSSANSNFGALTGSKATGTFPFHLATADFDGDGKLDVVVSNQTTGNIGVFLNTSTVGAVSFANMVSFAAPAGGSTPQYLVVGDMDGDGKPDVVATYRTGNLLGYYRNTSTLGSINFAAATGLSTGNTTTPESVTVGDFNGDGKLDIAATLLNNMISQGNPATTGSMIMFRNQGGVTPFSAGATTARTYTLTGSKAPWNIAVGDLNNDGKLDLATSNRFSDNITAMYNDGTSDANGFPNYTLVNRMTTPSPFTVGSFAVGSGGVQPKSLVISDLSCDSSPDIAVANWFSSGGTGTPDSALAIFQGDGTSNLAGYTRIFKTGTTDYNAGAGTGPHSLAIGDLNGDGKWDLVTGNWFADGTATFPGVSVFTQSTSSPLAFNTSTTLGAGAGGTTASILADIDGDGKEDLITTNGSDNTISVRIKQ